MLILRKKTFPIQSNQQVHKQKKTFCKLSKIKSTISNIQNNLDPILPSFNNQIFTQTNSTNHNFYRSKSHKENKKNQIDDLNRIIGQNKLTIDFKDEGKNTKIYMGDSYEKMKKLLINHGQYRHFKQMNQKQGCFHSILSEIQREYDVKKMKKIKIQKNSNFIVRQNLSIIHKQSIEPTSVREINVELQKIRNVLSYDKLSNLRYKTHSSSLKPYPRKMKGRNDKWNLKDFYDPIIQQLEKDESNIQKLRDRQIILYKLKQIEADCSKVDNYMQTTQSIQVFDKYSKNLCQKLTKKQKKIDKINFHSY